MCRSTDLDAILVLVRLLSQLTSTTISFCYDFVKNHRRKELVKVFQRISNIGNYDLQASTSCETKSLSRRTDIS